MDIPHGHRSMQNKRETENGILNCFPHNFHKTGNVVKGRGEQTDKHYRRHHSLPHFTNFLTKVVQSH